MSIYSVDRLIAEARRIAAEYRRTTGKTLSGIGGEIAEYDAARLLDLELCQPKPGGYDALGRGRRDGRRIQIKARVMFGDSKSGQRIGQLKTEQDWDAVVLVLMNDEFESTEIYEAQREDVMAAMEEARDSKRSKRGAMSVARFKNIAQLVWTAEEGSIDDDVWENRV